MFLPVALTVPTVDVTVATRIDVASAEAPAPDVSMIDEVIPGEVNVVAPVVVHVHVADTVMPAPAAAAVPPPAVMPAPVGADGEAELETGEDVDSEAQVERAPAPGHRPRIPERVDPTRIRVAGAVDHDWSRRNHRPEIARRVARVHDFWRGAVHVRIRDVVKRGARRDRIDHGRHTGRYRPRSGERRADKPHAVLEGVVRGRVDTDHREGCVHDVLQRRPLDRLELRRAVVVHGELRAVPADRRRLRDVVRDHGLSCLRCSRNRGEDRSLRMALRNPRKVPRRPGRHILPWALERLGSEPPARKEHVVVLLRRIEEEVVVGIRHLEDVGVGDRRQGGLTPEHDELCRDRAHVDRWDGPCLEELLEFGGRLVEQINLPALDGRVLGYSQ